MRGPRPRRRSSTSCRGQARAASSSPAATTPSCSGSTPSARPLSAGCSPPPASRRSLILLLLQASFGSWRLAMLSFLTLPMALVGGVLAAYLGGGIISLGSLVGLLHGPRHRGPQRHHADQPLPAPRARGGRDVRPGAGPPRRAGAALADPDDDAGDRAGAGAAGRRWADRPGHEIEHPMAIVILGGLVTSTLLNLFVVPSLYLRFGKGRRPRPRHDEPVGRGVDAERDPGPRSALRPRRRRRARACRPRRCRGPP